MGTTAGLSVTLANSIIGVGILAMPYCFQQCGVILATIILLFMGLVSRLCCYFLLKSALVARRRNFELLAFHIFGPTGKLAVELGIIGFLMGTCIAYFVVVGDLGPQIIAKMFNINQSDWLRTSIMIIVSVVCVLPLGLLRNVDSLSNVSAATIGFYFCLVIKVIAEAVSRMTSREWSGAGGAGDAGEAGGAGGVLLWRAAGVLQCVPIFSMALFCQAQLFEIFESLPSLSLEKMNEVSKNAINICTGVYFTLGLFGYIAFYDQNISGNILVSLSPTMTSDVIKLGFVMSLAFSFPLIIFPCRASVYSFLYRRAPGPQHEAACGGRGMPARAFRSITCWLVLAALLAALLSPHMERVLGLLGATVGVAVCVLFPAAGVLALPAALTARDALAAKGVFVLGLVILVLGTYANIQSEEPTYEKIDYRSITQERIDKMVEDFFEAKRLEKSDDFQLKLVKNYSPNNINDDKMNIEKDSEVQPPNPVPPPESKSSENRKDNEEIIEDKKLKEILEETKEVEDKPVEIHPKDLKTKINGAKIANGAKLVVDEPEHEKIKEETKPKTQTNEEKLDMIKQQKLIETIKQHGEEQKELIKEQKEILHEIRKTQQEIEQSKKEVDPDEAKKLAVESIQKIANMAIQSISGVTDKPIDKISNDPPIEKIVNEVVNDLAKKAAESIQNIEQSAPKVDTVQNIQPINSAANNQPANLQPIEQNVIPQIQNGVNPQPPIVPDNVQPNLNLNSQNIASNINKPPAVNVIPQQNIINNPPLNPPVNLNQVNKVVNPVPSLKVPSVIPQPIVSRLANQVNGKIGDKPIGKDHSHSADEPLSYKLGEDALNKPKKHSFDPSVPLPLAMNGNKNINLAEHNIENALRRKREIVNCNDRNRLKAEEKQICESPMDNAEQVLPAVDLNHVAFAKNVPVDIIHLRSLKSYEENREETRR